MIDETHESDLESWVDSANDPATDFPIQNLPFGRFRRRGAQGPWRIGIAIGDQVLDLRATGLIDTDDMTRVLEMSVPARRACRHALSKGLRRGSSRADEWRGALVPLDAVELGLPCEIRGYTDFYTGIHHAMAVGGLFRPDNPLLPNYKWIPIGYHGRVSSILPSGSAFRRPSGQLKAPDAAVPRLAPCARLDYELELGVILGSGNALGEPIPIDAAEDRVFGLTLLNDWSARDIQAWEYQPLGPFLSKNFATTLSPWIVTLDAMAPFRLPLQRPEGDPRSLPYLHSASNMATGSFDIELEVCIQTERMRGLGSAAERLSRSNYGDAAYWTIAQIIAHHTVNGCNLQSGDLLGTGTLSGPEPAQAGSMLELTQGGARPVKLTNGETRTFLADGDTIELKASCRREGFRRIGFGECRGTVIRA